MLKWYLPEGTEAHKPEAMRLLDDLVNGRVQFHAPSILPYESGNVLGRRAMKPVEDFDAFLALPISLHDLDPAGLRRTLVLQRERQVIFFDAAYLALAESMHAKLLTDDRALVTASRGLASSLAAWEPEDREGD